MEWNISLTSDMHLVQIKILSKHIVCSKLYFVFVCADESYRSCPSKAVSFKAWQSYPLLPHCGLNDKALHSVGDLNWASRGHRSWDAWCFKCHIHDVWATAVPWAISVGFFFSCDLEQRENQHQEIKDLKTEIILMLHWTLMHSSCKIMLWQVIEVHFHQHAHKAYFV